MTKQQQTFEEFLRGWTVERIVAIGDRVDPGDREFMAKRRASELADAARERGLYSELLKAAQPYGNVLGFVRDLYRSAERKAAGNF